MINQSNAFNVDLNQFSGPLDLLLDLAKSQKVKIEFIIKIDEMEVNLFDLQIMDPYASEETAIFISESNNWKLDNLIWPVDWCEDIK